MLSAGLILTRLNSKNKILINKIATCLILISLVMLNQVLLSLDIDLFKNQKEEIYQKSIIKDNY